MPTAALAAVPDEAPLTLDGYAKRILTARVYEVATETSLDPMPRLSGRLGRAVKLKREDTQPVFSFKIRGAYNRVAHLSPADQARGVICASAGNHAQGVALAAKHLGIAATIVMPTTTPQIKVDAVAAWGARIVLAGDAFDQAYGHAMALAAAEGLTFVHPYDDPDVIAGQGTVGMEILRQQPVGLDAVFVPIGGGGLAAGVAAFIKYLAPAVKVIGVEPEEAASMAAAIDAGERVMLDRVGLFADGVAVRQAGVETFRLCRALLDGVVIVSTDEICAAIKDIFEDTRTIAEPAGALALAGLKRWVADGGGGDGTLVAIDSGANMNFDRLRHVAERAEIGEHREALFAVTIPERPGSYRAFVEHLEGRFVTEFNYRYAGGTDAHVFVGIQLSAGEEEKRGLLAKLRSEGFPVIDMTDDEMAKLHIRYMVGGRVAGLADERLFRFQFPERPGALKRFLERMSGGWNISLFHYRNHGADYGRVLAGIQIPKEDTAAFDRYVESLGYPCTEETANPAYRVFLSAP